MQFIVYLVYPHLMCHWFGTNTNPQPAIYDQRKIKFCNKALLIPIKLYQ